MFSYKLLVLLLFITAGGIAVESMRFLPSLDVSNTFFEQLWRRLYGTSMVDVGKYVTFMVMITLGFCYVNMVSLKGKRKHPFHSRNGTTRDFILICIFSPFLYLLGAQIAIKGVNDVLALSECASSPDGLTHPALFYIFHTHSCPDHQKSLTHRETAVYNVFYYVIPFFLGINFNHLHIGRLANIKFTRHHMKRWQFLEWTFFCVGISTFASILIYYLRIYHIMGRLTYYLILSVLPLPLIVLVGKIGIRSFYVHVHHSNISMLFYALFGLQRPFPSALQALCLGVMIEGVAHWGLEFPIGKKAGGHTGKRRIIHLDEEGCELHSEEKMYKVPISSQLKYV